MIFEHCGSFTFFYLMSSSVGNTIQTRFISCFQENKSKSVNILILLFYIFPLRSIVALQFHAFFNSFMNTAYKF